MVQSVHESGMMGMELTSLQAPPPFQRSHIRRLLASLAVARIKKNSNGGIRSNAEQWKRRLCGAIFTASAQTSGHEIQVKKTQGLSKTEVIVPGLQENVG